MGACELKRQAKLEHWRTQIIDCRSSGMSVKRWCAEHNMSTKTYYRWEKEILSLHMAILPGRQGRNSRPDRALIGGQPKT